MSDVTSTQALIQRVQDGDDEALNQLYERYQSRVLAAVRARLGAELRSKVESWDIVQETMLGSFKNIQSFQHDSEGAFLNWLAKIAENRIRDQLDFIRAARRDHRKESPLQKPRSGDPSIPLEILDEHDIPTPSQMLMLTEEMARLEEAMDRLPDEIRELIIATKVEGRSYQEIAQTMQKSPDAVRMQVNRAMVVLTNEFQKLEAN